MKKIAALFFAALSSMILVDSAARKPDSALLNPSTFLAWNTFLGPTADPGGSSGGQCVSDQNGNVYVSGTSDKIWGNPIDPFNPYVYPGGDSDVFVAKLSPSGVVRWNTFLGIFTSLDGWSAAEVHPSAMTIDGNGNVYVICSKSAGDEVYVAKINSLGARQWLVSIGGVGTDVGQAIAVDGSGNVYVGGSSGWTWGTPVHAFDDPPEAFFAKLNSNGVVQWNTFWGAGAGKFDNCMGIAVDGNGNVYATGRSNATWGWPIRPYTPSGDDAFVVKFDASGVFQWNTFLGAAPHDWGRAIRIGVDGNVYVAGTSLENWGSPVTPFHGSRDVFVAKLDPSGSVVWNAFLGSTAADLVNSLVLDSNCNSYLVGFGGRWGSPDRSEGGVFAAKLDSAGNTLWNTFLGGTGVDNGQGICLDPIGNIIVSGTSTVSWGSPILPLPGTWPRAFVAKIGVTQQQAILSTSKSDMIFGAVAGGPKSSDQKFQITNEGMGIMDWALTSNRSWLSCSPTSGYGPATITVSADPAGLPAGTTDTGAVQIASTLAFNSPQAVNVHLGVFAPGASLPPFGSFDTPINGTTGVVGAIPVTGWALDDIGIDSVKIWRDPVLSAGEANSLYYIGDAVLVEGARPDVETAQPNYPQNAAAGWGYMLLTNMLPNHGNGIYKLYAYATDKEGNTVLLGTKIIGCDNAHAEKPFGTIDTPGQGGTSGGTFYNFGWVLTPLNGTVPKDGHTITVYVDGVLLGNLSTPPNVYNQYRSDVSNNFPGLNNTGGPGAGGPVGAFSLNTTGYSNGVHSIFWIAYDDLGRGEGIGSRFFNILNAGSSPESAPAAEAQAEPTALLSDLSVLPFSFKPVRVKTGFDLSAEFLSRLPDADGILRIEIPEVNRVEIELGDQPEAAAFLPGGAHYSGYMIVGDALRPLPVGSTLDRRTGRFSWMPGPGFLGTYDLVFIQSDGLRFTRKVTIKVMIIPFPRRPQIPLF